MPHLLGFPKTHAKPPKIALSPSEDPPKASGFAFFIRFLLRPHCPLLK